MNWKTLIKALLFPRLALMFLLLPLATILLTAALMLWGSMPVVPYVVYVLAAYTLTVWCLRIPTVVRRARAFARENSYIRLWQSDAHLRMRVSLGSALMLNALYGSFFLGLGFYHRTFWFASLGTYYICLAALRLHLARYARKYAPGERVRDELLRYRACGWAFLVMSPALLLIVFFMVYFGRSFEHHMITAITMAAYAFGAFAVTVYHAVKYRRNASPLRHASDAISLSSALVSMLTLASTMLTTFDSGKMTAVGQKWLLGITGSAVLALTVGMAVYMIRSGTKGLNAYKEKKDGE